MSIKNSLDEDSLPVKISSCKGEESIHKKIKSKKKHIELEVSIKSPKEEQKCNAASDKSCEICESCDCKTVGLQQLTDLHSELDKFSKKINKLQSDLQNQSV